MKGFIYLLEISVALILIVVVLGTLSSFKTKENWERADLITVGDNIVRTIRDSDIIEILNNNFTKIQSLLPPHIDFGLKVNGIPKSNITVGCAQSSICNSISTLLTNSFANGHWTNFSVEYFDIASGIPSYYDAVVFVNYTDYTNRKSNIIDYLNRGGVVIGVNATFNNNNADFNEIFGLSSTSSGSGIFNFTTYNPSIDEIEKYFLGLGFDVNTGNTVDSKKWGYWYIWENSRKVNITSNAVDIENKTVDEGIIKDIPEGGFFNIKNIMDNKFYTFKIKKIFWDKFVIIQPLNMSFAFNDFSEADDVTGKVNIVALPGGQAEMTSNKTAIWISDFPTSDEYRTLVKSAIASRVKEWYLKEPNLTKEYVTVSSFYPLCCDMSETAELTIYLWYKI